MNSQVEEWMQQLTLEEKVALTTGLDMWHSLPVERLGIPSISLCDGPHGVRKPLSGDEPGIGMSHPATCFPTASALGCTFDRGLIEEVGRALGVEAQALDVQVLLGPGLNIKRTPLCGRNFEYFSEDPVLSGELAGALIRGIQAEGVAACVKHFACNNQEFERMSMDVQVDPSTLHEIYLSGFARAIEQGKPLVLMASYNKVNGVHATENGYLLTEILRNEWGFDGLVVSDWGAVNDKVAALRAGLDLEMPGGVPQDRVLAMMASGELSTDVLDAAVRRVLDLVNATMQSRREQVRVPLEAHHALAHRAAAESIVLLKNENNALPVHPTQTARVAVIGQMAREPRFQGAGSSQIVPTHVDAAWDALTQVWGSDRMAFARGYGDGNGDDVARADVLIAEAVQVARDADAAIVFVGLPDAWESEALDRKHIDLPAAHNRLVTEVSAVQRRTIVVLANGSPVAMPWVGQVGAIVEGWLGGQASGRAIADVLTGQVNPSGKLAETFPVQLVDTPAYLNYPGSGSVVRYGEGLFVGYRYYEKKHITPLFPFGHGLSYTTFHYDEMTVDRDVVTNLEEFNVRLTLTNTGSRVGSEVVQVYVQAMEPQSHWPDKELKAFAKVTLQAGEARDVTLTVRGRELTRFDPARQAWQMPDGPYVVAVGASSADIRLRKEIRLRPARAAIVQFGPESLVKEFLAHPVARAVVQPLIPPEFASGLTSEAPDFMSAMLLDLPIHKVVGFSRGLVSQEMLTGLIAYVNAQILMPGDPTV
ncbi:MAG: glycoside hydrolase family 3 C-terminal domain-containing protein [Firmicutes bacterium]|nr:glycoside hydrolase family 3 C-terminal domain-containing protein [Bacillota bacterium]